MRRVFVKPWIPNPDYPKDAISLTDPLGHYGEFPDKDNANLLDFVVVGNITKAVVAMDDGSVRSVELELIRTCSENSGHINIGMAR